MRDYSFDKISIVIGEQNFEARKAMRSTLQSNGFRNVEDFSNTEQMRAYVKGSTPDLIIGDLDLPGGDFCTVCTDIRNQLLADDPFVPIILYAGEITPANLGMISGAGVDHVLQKPISVADLLIRIRHLIERRKPFVVTEGYIGPDRRNTVRDGINDLNLIDLPNVMKAKAENDTSKIKQLLEERRSAMLTVNTHKVQHHAETIVGKVEQVLPMLDEVRTEEATDILNKILEITTDVQRRLGSTEFGHIANLCDVFSDAVFRIDEEKTAARKDIMLLKPLSQAIVAAFNNEQSSVETAKKIIHMIDSSIQLD